MRKGLALLCAAALAVGLLCIGAGASQQVPTLYQLSVNDKLPAPSASTTPIEVSGVIYVPYTVFDKSVTEVDLGVYANELRTSTQYLLTLYSLNSTLRFDLNANTSEDRDGASQNMRAIIRNRRVYIPASAVCTFFGLSYSLTPTQYGTLVRITNGNEYLRGEKFLGSAANLMRTRYEEYLQSLNPAAPTPSATPPPAVTPTPSQPDDPPEDDKREVRVYLAFLCGEGESLDGILSALDRSGIQALFLFRPEDLAGHADQLRRLVGSGHLVGLRTAAGTAEEALADLDGGRLLLEELVRLRPHTVLAEGGDAALTAALEEAGWTCWRTNASGVPAEGQTQSALAYAVLQTVDRKRSEARVLMDDSAPSAGALPRILNTLRAEEYDLRLPVETEL